MPDLWLWVEGRGEYFDPRTGRGGAAAVLARRILNERLEAFAWQRIQTAKVGGLHTFRRKMERMVAYLRQRREVDAVLVLLDLDDGCAAETAREVAEELRALNPPKPIALVFAVREYEAWFLASAESLWGQPYLGDPEGRRDAKGEVRRNFLSEYAPTIHQASLSARMSLEEAASNSRSFRRLLHAVEELQEAIAAGEVVVTPARGARPSHSAQSA